MSDSLSFANLTELGAKIRTKSLSPVDLCEHFLQRIDRFNPKLNAYLAVAADRAMATARAAEAAIGGGQYLGPLHGIPVALKDLIDVAGLPTTGGSLLYSDRVAAEDSTVARRMAAAGTVLLGKTHQVEFAFGGVGINHHHGTPWNPWDAETHRIPGGSSSGSGVAVAAGMTAVALGSDTGGSVRIPASFCGLVGLKPTYGRISRLGLMPLDSTLDSAGPMTRTVRDAALLYQTLAGPDPSDSQTWNRPVEDVLQNLDDGVAGMRLCIPEEYFWDGVNSEVGAAVRAAAEQLSTLRAQVDPISLTELDELIELRGRGSLVSVETYLNLRTELENHLDEFDPIVSARMLDGISFTAVDYLDIKRQYEDLQRRTCHTMQTIDALIAPTTPILPPPLEEADQAEHYDEVNGLCLRNTMAANLLGLCAISVPCGFSESGLPIGLQLIGRPFDEARILRIAQTYEEATEWSKETPNMDGFDR